MKYSNCMRRAPDPQVESKDSYISQLLSSHKLLLELHGTMLQTKFGHAKECACRMRLLD